MDAFIRKHLSLVLSIIYLIIGLSAAGYVGLYIPAKANRADIAKVISYFNKENATLEKRKSFILMQERKRKIKNHKNQNFALYLIFLRELISWQMTIKLLSENWLQMRKINLSL